MTITTILPVSRTKYLDRVLESLLKQTHKPNNLIAIFDGSDEDFVAVRNKILELDFEQKLCVKSTNSGPGATIAERRINISNIHNQIAEILPSAQELVPEDYEPSWVFSIEDDGILPPNALERLVAIAESKPDAGMITGVELGRWGSFYVGAWRTDDVFKPRAVTSLESKTKNPTIDEIDACGLYCALIRADYYVQHRFFSSNGLGPDVNLGLFLRQQGFKNYIDWSVHVTHLTSFQNLEIEIPATDRSIVVKFTYQSEGIWYVSS